jgi:hypothetical protein
MNNNKEQTIPTTIPPYLKLTKDQKDSLTEDLANNIKIYKGKKNIPIMEIPVKYLCEIMGINNPPSNEDKLVFTLASYRSEDDVTRYNSKQDPDRRVEQEELKFHPTILVSLQKDGLISEDFYDVATIKPPPVDTE